MLFAQLGTSSKLLILSSLGEPFGSGIRARFCSQTQPVLETNKTNRRNQIIDLPIGIALLAL